MGHPSTSGGRNAASNVTRKMAIIYRKAAYLVGIATPQDLVDMENC